MKPTALSAKPFSFFRRTRTLAAFLLGMALLPGGTAFAEEPATPAAAATAAEAPAANDAALPAAVSAGNAELASKLEALGADATPQQIRETTRQTLTEQGVPAEEIEKTLEAMAQAENIGAGLDDAALEEPAMAHDLSPWGMYQGADVVVKGVMIGLILASILTWTVWLAKTVELTVARRRLRRELPVLKAARTLKDAGNSMNGEACISHRLVQDALEEVKLSGNVQGTDGIKERVSFRLERLVAACGRQMSQGTGVLATIGSTAPFVGLFGTVWGIMNSFIGIAKTQTTNLAVVAPGIAEALLATALGLVAAIPAVVIYNAFARSIASYKAQVSDASAQVLLLVSRDLDHLPGERQAPHMVKAG
ncbi:tonB-system energizer ExbB [Pseudomonas sp. GOM7]|uniref:tonB-system energizer ExbB n=1 Tax=unclassified Pseudomonas TaxID=196821 RepID=UPI00227B929F|nr:MULTISPECIES: tonB-system energizer ExbB [unclassified Pseudomonas]WAJ37445.1 tonB-system energizer ExbB [Pseudomonas sp. GOM7]